MTSKEREIDALYVFHSAVLDQFHISDRLKHSILIGDNSRLKNELVKSQEALASERSSKFSHLKSIFEFLKNDSPNSSSFTIHQA